MDTKNGGCCKSGQSGHGAGRTGCPVCGDDGKSVLSRTVGHLVRSEYSHQVTDGQYKICMKASCDVVYFNVDDGDSFTKGQVKVPIWFKNGAKPRFACYCSEVTEEQVLDAVVRLGSESVKDVNAATGAMKNPNCIERNPLGVCCHKIIEEAIAKGKSLR